MPVASRILLAAAFMTPASFSFAADAPPVENAFRAVLGVEAIWLDRTGEPNADILTALTPGPSLDADGLDLPDGLGAGGHVELYRGQFGVSGRAFGAEWDEQTTLATGGLFVLGTDPDLFGFGVPAAIFDYSSSLKSYEANLIWAPHRRFELFAGVRKFEIDDELLATFDLPTDAIVDVAAENDYFGVQIGAQGRLQASDFGETFGGLFLEADGRVAFLENSRDLDFSFANVGGAVPASVSDDTDALLFELNAKLGYTFERFEIYGAYRYMAISDVALAPDNLDSVNIATGVGGISGADLEYHGFTFGLQATF